MKDLKWKEKASYTVEASWIMAISLGIIMFLVLGAFECFFYALDTVQQPGEDIPCVKLFREETKRQEQRDQS